MKKRFMTKMTEIPPIVLLKVIITESSTIKITKFIFF